MLKLQYFVQLMRSQLIGKDSDAGKDSRQEKRGMTEDEIVGWHHRFNEHKFEQAPGFGDGQGYLACCSPWGHKELDMTDWTELNWGKIWRPPSWHISKPCCSPSQFASLRFYNIAQMLCGFGAFCFCLRTQDLCGDLQSVELCPLESFWLSRQRTLS